MQNRVQYYKEKIKKNISIEKNRQTQHRKENTGVLNCNKYRIRDIIE